MGYRSLNLLLCLLLLGCSVTQSQNSPQEKSVKPGINKKYLKPNLKVKEWVKRFEGESREIYKARYDIVEKLQLKPGMRVADVGSGTGLFIPFFSKKVETNGWVFAIDIAPGFIDHIRQKAKEYKIEQITPVLCYEDSINLPPNSVDLVFICDTYHHFEYPKTSLASIYHALRSGGALVIIDFERIPGKSQSWIFDHVRAGKEVFRKEIEEAGFKFSEEVKIDSLKENYFLRFYKD